MPAACDEPAWTGCGGVAIRSLSRSAAPSKPSCASRRLAEAGEDDRAAAALAAYALGVAEEAAAGLETEAGEAAAARWLDAEDATMRQVLTWAMDHDAAGALRLAVALAPWWTLRGRAAGEYAVLREAADRAEAGSDLWCSAQFWLGQTALASVDEAGDLPAAEEVCAAGLARSRQAGDVWNQTAMLPLMADLDVQASRFEDAAAHLRKGVQITARTGHGFALGNVLEVCAYLCAATGRHAEAVTLLAATGRIFHLEQPTETAPWVRRRREVLRQAGQVLGPDRPARPKSGAAMSPATAAEYVLLLTAPTHTVGGLDRGPGQLSASERELVMLVAQGRTDAQIADQLSVSVRTIRSRLDRIRDKTGCRRRADLTRPALRLGLV
jgi:DNA-binding CsgD family transcriptional regulator